MKRRRDVSTALTATVCSLAIAACGSSSHSSSLGESRSYASFLSFSTCMRSHGVSNFPDPSPGGGIHIAIGSGSGLDPRSPAFQSARQVCKKLLPGGGPPSALSVSQRAAALANAQCMRSHGVPNFPDPSANGSTLIPSSSGIDPQSPAFQHATKACGGAGAIRIGP
jgi:hypothetical protein